MAIDASIYNILNPQGLQQGLAGIGEAYSRGQEQTARLASLAQQKELQDMQLAQMKQQSALYPQQLAEAQRKRETEYMQNVSREIAQAPENAENILSKHATLAPQYGVNPENITWLASDLMTAPDITKLQQRALYHANPAEFEKGMIKSQFEQPKGTPSQVATMIKEYEAATGQKMPMEEQARLYKQGLETKTSPQQFMQIATGEGGAQYVVQAPKVAGAAPKVTGLGITKPQAAGKGGTPEEKAAAQEQASLSSQQVLDQAAKLLAHPGRSAGTGASAWMSKIPGTEAKGFAANLETLKSQTFLPMVAALKGMGALSDAEGKKITASVGALDPEMPEKEFEDSLKETAKFLFSKAKAAGLNVQMPVEFGEIQDKGPKVQTQGNIVTLPNGQTKQFPSAAAAQAFKKAAGIKD